MNDYDLSILNEFMLPNPLVMFRTKISRHKLVATETISIWVRNSFQTFKYILHNISRISVFSSVPPNGMPIFYMLGVILKKLKVFESIICPIKIDMMHCFFGVKFSTKMLLHDMSMLKNTLTFDPYSIITIVSKLGLSLFKQSPFRRNIIVPMSMKSTPMLLTYTPCSRIKNSGTILDSAYITFSHNTIITCGVN